MRIGGAATGGDDVSAAILDAAEVRQAAQGRWQNILSALSIEVSIHPRKHTACPSCGGKDRFRFDDQEGRGSWYCNQCDPHAGDGFALVMNVRRCSFQMALELVSGTLGIAATDPRKFTTTPKVKTRPTPPEGTLGQDVYRYEDASGRPVLFVKRFDLPEGGKRFVQWGPTENGHGWQNNAANVPKPRPLYRLSQVLASPADELIVVHEGEKAVHAAINAALPGTHTTTVGGASNPEKTDFSPLKGRDVVLIPDHDEPGESYAQTVARLTTEAGARSVRIVRLPELPAKGDVVEWLGARQDSLPNSWHKPRLVS